MENCHGRCATLRVAGATDTETGAGPARRVRRRSGTQKNEAATAKRCAPPRAQRKLTGRRRGQTPIREFFKELLLWLNTQTHTQTPCPPRSAVPVNQGRGSGVLHSARPVRFRSWMRLSRLFATELCHSVLARQRTQLVSQPKRGARGATTPHPFRGGRKVLGQCDWEVSCRWRVKNFPRNLTERRRECFGPLSGGTQILPAMIPPFEISWFLRDLISPAWILKIFSRAPHSMGQPEYALARHVRTGFQCDGGRSFSVLPQD